MNRNKTKYIIICYLPDNSKMQFVRYYKKYYKLSLFCEKLQKKYNNNLFITVK